MISWKTILLVIVFLFASSLNTFAQAADIYVATNGSDSTGDGTLAKPFATLVKAQTVILQGGTVYLRAGIYPEATINKSGAAGALITFKPYNNETVIFDAQQKGVDTLSLKGVSYVKISGFEVRGSASNWGAGLRVWNTSSTAGGNNIIEGNKVYNNTGSNTSGILIEDSSNNQVLNNDVYGNYWTGIWVIQHDSVTPGGVTGNKIVGNRAYNNVLAVGNADGIGFKGANLTNSLIANNEAFGNGDDGIDTWNSHNNQVLNNISHDNIIGDSNGFKLGGSTTGGYNLIVGNIAYKNKNHGFVSNDSGNNNFYHNVAYSNTGFGFEDGYRGTTCSTCPNVFINNVGLNNTRANFNAGAATLTSHNNLWFDTSANAPRVMYKYTMTASLAAFYSASGNKLDNPNGGNLSSLAVNPLFNNLSSFDFSLAATSPLIDKGDPANPGKITVVGVPDIGAKEFASTISSPLPSASPAGKPGDANGDNQVDGVDYVIWLEHYNQSVSGPSSGDFNNSGKVDGVDYVIWLNGYGK